LREDFDGAALRRLSRMTRSANRARRLLFTSYDNVVDHCCEAWDKLVDQPWRIMTIGRRNWAHGP
jgi:hypothetical protein